MSGDVIAICIIAWIALGFIALATITNDGLNPAPHVMLMVFFWPISLPILAVFGAVFTVFASCRTGIQMFKENK